MTTAFSIVACTLVALAGIGISLAVLVLVAASGANSSQVEVRVLKAFIACLTVGIGLALLGVPAGLVLGRAPLAFVVAALPVIAGVVVFLAWLEFGAEPLPDDYRVPAGKLVVRLLFFAVFGGAGLVGIYVGAREFFTQRLLLADARPVPATILESRVATTRSSDTDHRPLRDNSTTSHSPEVRFRYELDGRTYESDRLRPSGIGRGYAGRSAAEAELAPFPAGATVTAYVSPALPDKGYLVRESSAGPVVFVVLGFLLAPACQLVFRWV